jgi:hypothetical protein
VGQSHLRVPGHNVGATQSPDRSVCNEDSEEFRKGGRVRFFPHTCHGWDLLARTERRKRGGFA